MLTFEQALRNLSRVAEAAAEQQRQTIAGMTRAAEAMRAASGDPVARFIAAMRPKK